MFSAQPALLPAGLAVAEPGTVLQDGRQPATSSWASPETGRGDCSVKPRAYCKARTVTALSCCISEATGVTRASATRETANSGMYLAISCQSPVPFPVTRAHTLERRENKHHLLTCWLDQRSTEGSPFFLPKNKQVKPYHVIACVPTHWLAKIRAWRLYFGTNIQYMLAEF